MADLLIRDLPDELVERLDARARLHGQTLEEHIRGVLEAAVRTDRDKFLRFAREMRERSGPQTSDSTEIIRQARDSTR